MPCTIFGNDGMHYIIIYTHVTHSLILIIVGVIVLTYKKNYLKINWLPCTSFGNDGISLETFFCFFWLKEVNNVSFKEKKNKAVFQILNKINWSS